MIPGVIAVLLIIFFIKEKKKAGANTSPSPSSPPLKGGEILPKLTLKHFDWRFKFFVIIASLFAVGNSSDVFLILRAQQVGISTLMIPMVYLLFNLIYSLSSIPAGMAADRFGKKRVILLGFVLFAFLYYGFGAASDTKAIWILFGLYGLFMGLTEGIQKAFLATIIPQDFKATAFGVYNTLVGLAMFPASLIGGWLWDHVSPSATFYFGAITASVSAILFIVFITVVRRTDAART
jgi:MFS family permease